MSIECPNAGSQGKTNTEGKKTGEIMAKVPDIERFLNQKSKEEGALLIDKGRIGSQLFGNNSAVGGFYQFLA